jgi:hypothetical protein
MAGSKLHVLNADGQHIGSYGNKGSDTQWLFFTHDHQVLIAAVVTLGSGRTDAPVVYVIRIETMLQFGPMPPVPDFIASMVLINMGNAAAPVMWRVELYSRSHRMLSAE